MEVRACGGEGWVGEEEARRVRVSHKVGPGMPGEWAEKKKTKYGAVINVLSQYGSITRHDQRRPSPVLSCPVLSVRNLGLVWTEGRGQQCLHLDMCLASSTSLAQLFPVRPLRGIRSPFASCYLRRQ